MTAPAFENAAIERLSPALRGFLERALPLFAADSLDDAAERVEDPVVLFDREGRQRVSALAGSL